MPWQEQSRMSLREEFCVLVSQETMSLSEVCRRYGISRPTGRLWLARWRAMGRAGLVERSRRPHTSPRRTRPELEAAIVAARAAHPRWGGRTLHHWLLRQGHADVPAPSTITEVLRRHGLLVPEGDATHRWERFEHPAPNALWQMDFMGHLPLARGRLHPLAIIDDHSRFALVVAAHPHERLVGVQTELTACFQRYGLPQVILTDNGPPWGTSGVGGMTRLEAWLLRLDIEVWHGRAYHPQTQGKVERFHGTLRAEAMRPTPFADLAAAQAAFDRFRHTYNQERPHAALGYAVPASRYAPSPRAFPPVLPEPVYGPDDAVRRVRDQGAISYAHRSHFISRGLIGEQVAVRPTAVDGVVAVYFCTTQVATLDLRLHPEA